MADRTALPLAPPPADAVEAPVVGARTGWAAWWRAELRAGLEVAALVGLVVTQPLLDVLGRSPDFFLFHRAQRSDVLYLVALITIVPTVSLVGLGMLGRVLGRRARGGWHAVVIGLLLAALAVQVGRRLLPLRGVALLLLAALAGAAGLAAYRRWRAPGQLLRIAAVGPLVFVGLFVFASPASAVVLPARTDGSGSGVAQGPGGHPPVVLLVLDELPMGSLLGADGRIDATRFPHFAELAAGSTWYREASGVSGWTPYALPAMLTGRYPQRDAAPHYGRYPDNLFTALGGLYDIRAQESITRLCPPSRCGENAGSGRGGLEMLVRESTALLGRIAAPVESRTVPEDSYQEPTREEAGLDAAEPTPDDPRFRWDTLDDNQPARFTSFLAGLHPAPRPTLHFLHLLMPHSPWTYLPSGARYDAPEDLPNDGPGWVELARQRHLAQLGYTDRLIGETLRTLRERGLYDEALLVVTADHGVSFTQGAQGRGMGAIDAAAGEVLRVPLFVKEPGQHAARVDARNWEHVDLLPTIAELARIRLPWRVDGIAATGPPRERADKRFYDRPGQPVVVPPQRLATPAPPVRSALVGTAVADHPVGPGAGRAEVANRAAFRAVSPGRLPALVWGSMSAATPDGTLLAVAVNGRIGAVVPAVAPDPEGRRFAALITDDGLFRAGLNRLEVYQVAGETLRPFSLA